MLDTGTRTAILALHQRGLSKRRIARTLLVSRDAVDSVIASGNEDVPKVWRPEKPDAHRDEIIDLYQACSTGQLLRHNCSVSHLVDRTRSYILPRSSCPASCFSAR